MSIGLSILMWDIQFCQRKQKVIIHFVIHTDFINYKNTVKSIMDIKIQGNKFANRSPVPDL